MSNVNHPQHYGGKDNPYEAIKVIEAWDLGFSLGNTIKYIARAGKKGNATLQDSEKARWYLDREINKYKKVEDFVNVGKSDINRDAAADLIKLLSDMLGVVSNNGKIHTLINAVQTLGIYSYSPDSCSFIKYPESITILWGDGNKSIETFNFKKYER